MEDTWNFKPKLPKTRVSYTMVSSSNNELYYAAQRGANLSLLPAASAEASGGWERRAHRTIPRERGTGKKILTSLWRLSSFRRPEVSAAALASRAQITHSLRESINWSGC